MNNSILVTGAAGFIGANLVKRIIETIADITVVGLDNVNDYYDVSLKEYRLKLIEEAAQKNPCAKWHFVRKKRHLKHVYNHLIQFLHLLFHSSCQIFLSCYKIKMDSDIQGDYYFKSRMILIA